MADLSNTPAPSSLEPRGDSKQLIGQNFIIRLGARIADLIVTLAVVGISVWGGGSLVSVYADASGNNSLGPNDTTTTISLIALILSLWLYHIMFFALHGSTPGKLLFKLVVVNIDGTPVSWRGSVIREVLYLLDAPFWGIVGAVSITTSKLHQRVGDLVANTLVVKRSEVAPENLRDNQTFLRTCFIVALVIVGLDGLLPFILIITE
jgi:uncharacterized RDD family membrane protein YckC